MSYLARSCKSKELETQTNVNLISMSAPYMLHLHPVTIPSAVSDTIGFDNTKFEDADSADGSMTDGMEHIFNSSTQLRYGRDLRLNEVNFSSPYLSFPFNILSLGLHYCVGVVALLFIVIIVMHMYLLDLLVLVMGLLKYLLNRTVL